MFQFPSNGKVHSKFDFQKTGEMYSCLVSIPFKRESAFQVGGPWGPRMRSVTVSIPFKRESAFQESPHFKPSGAVGSKSPKNIRELRGAIFFIKI